MERTDSTVIQVAPAYENAKIQEVQGFGVNCFTRVERAPEPRRGSAVPRVH